MATPTNHSARDQVDESDGEREIPLALAQQYAAESPILARMISKGLPLSRNAYLTLAWGRDRPKDEDWTAEHEAELPEPFQRPLRHTRHRQQDHEA